jgi:hypothetical protein
LLEEQALQRGHSRTLDAQGDIGPASVIHVPGGGRYAQAGAPAGFLIHVAEVDAARDGNAAVNHVAVVLPETMRLNEYANIDWFRNMPLCDTDP